MKTVLLVDDEVKLLEVLSFALEEMGYDTLTAETAEKALSLLEKNEVHLVLSDLRLPGLDGRALLQAIKKINPSLPVIIMTAYASLKDAIEIIKEGAFDYTVKPFELESLEATVASAIRFSMLGKSNDHLLKELKKNYSVDQLIGESPACKELLQKINKVSVSNSNVLITGESGTGKELVARAIHYTSSRSSSPLVTINSAAIPEALLESELFGHVKGAFTGATTNKLGRFVQADGGTLFLDEIGDMPQMLQAKILRCIQERVIEPVGSNTSRKVDVRIIAATNRDLQEAIVQGTFRQDLFYRLNVFPIIVPSLKQRTEDIPLLSTHFAKKFGTQMGKSAIEFTPEIFSVMQEYAWPGNIRELENAIERLTIVAGGREITISDLHACGIAGKREKLLQKQSQGKPYSFPLHLDPYLEEQEKKLILHALEETSGVQVKAAELLGISERSMWHRIKKLGITIHTKKEIS